MNARIRGFDGVRGIAAMTVVAIHANTFVGWGPRRFGLLAPVTVFFVLSGFLITRNLLLERDRFGSVSLPRFWRNRALRILPAYVAFLIAIGIAGGSGYLVHVTARHYGMAIGYVSNFVHLPSYSGHLGATWSLAVEEHFYLLWPLVFVAVPARWLGRVVVGALAACAVARVLIASHPGLSLEWLAARWTLPASDALLVGCLLAVWCARRDPTMAPEKKSRQSATVLVAAVVLFSASTWMPAPWTARWGVATYEFQVIGIALGLWWLFTNQSSILVRVLEVGVLRYLGRISYGIYIWQGFWQSTGPYDQVHWLQRPPQSVVVILLTATMSWYLVERPFLRWKARPAPPVAPSSTSSVEVELPSRADEVRG